MNLRDKVDLYNLLLSALSKGVKLAAILSEQGKQDDRARVEKKNNTLAGRAADLRRGIQREWNGRAAAIADEIRSHNRRLQDQIREIERELQNAERIVKALGYLDDVIAIAGRLLGA